MAKRERDKGKLGEREVAAVFTEAGLPAYRSAALQAGDVEGAGDVTVRPLPDLFVESKRQETYELGKWERQTDEACPVGSAPVIAYRKSRQPWRASVRLEWLAALLAEVVQLRRELAAADAALEEVISGVPA